jgi:hypothetical protein
MLPFVPNHFFQSHRTYQLPRPEPRTALALECARSGVLGTRAGRSVPVT